MRADEGVEARTEGLVEGRGRGAGRERRGTLRESLLEREFASRTWAAL